jgi:hypothetical protein
MAKRGSFDLLQRQAQATSSVRQEPGEDFFKSHSGERK